MDIPISADKVPESVLLDALEVEIEVEGELHRRQWARKKIHIDIINILNMILS